MGAEADEVRQRMGTGAEKVRKKWGQKLRMYIVSDGRAKDVGKQWEQTLRR